MASIDTLWLAIVLIVVLVVLGVASVLWFRRYPIGSSVAPVAPPAPFDGGLPGVLPGQSGGHPEPPSGPYAGPSPAVPPPRGPYAGPSPAVPPPRGPYAGP
jgi:hypothetical protein